MRHNNHQYRFGEKNLVKCKKNSKRELESMGPFLITQINDNGMVHFQKGIINNTTNIRRLNHSTTNTYQHLKISFILSSLPPYISDRY